MTPRTETADVVIVGGGPAGLAAAAALADFGRILILEREPFAGGVPRHCGHSPFGLREFRRLMRGPAYARRLVETTVDLGVEILTAATVTALHPGPALTVSTPEGMLRVEAKHILLATGARETPRGPRMIGGTRPAGVMTAGTLQAIIYGGGPAPFHLPVILGSELVAFSALLTCRHAGILPLAMAEPNDRATARWPAALLPRLMGVPFLPRTEVLAVEGRDRVEGVVLRQGERTWRESADGLIVTGGFRPDAVLLTGSHIATDPRTGGPVVDGFGRTSDPDIFAAGNLLRGVETAGHCWAEGRAVAGAIRKSLAGKLPETGPELRLEPGSAISWALPQRPLPDGPLGGLHLRLSRPARGLVTATDADGTTRSWQVDSRPERRIRLPLGGWEASPPLTVEFREERP